jgi:hypothetical protein
MVGVVYRAGMKLRLRGNSIRLRLTQREVTALVATGRVEESVGFDARTKLTYALTTGATFRARFEGGEVEVQVPSGEASEWAASDRVSLETEQPIGDGESLRILVEKDWQCLRPRAGEDESDAYPHPTGHC